MEGKCGFTGRGEQQIGAKRRLPSGHRDGLAGHALARHEVPAFVKLAVIRQKDLGNCAEQQPAVDHDCAIVEMPARPQRRPDDEYRRQFTADFDKPADFGFDLVEQSALKQQVVDRVRGQPELRK